MKSAQRLSSIPAYPFARWGRTVNQLVLQGIEVIRLDMGNPDLAPPEEVVQSLCQSARRSDHHGYPGYAGIPSLREAIASYYQRRFQVTLDPDTEVVTLIGSKEGIINLSLACLDAGDVVLVPDPGYAPYTVGANLAGAEVFTFPLLRNHGFLPDLQAIPTDLAAGTTLMWLNYPNNPTGATADLQFFAQAVEMAQRHGFLLCHDAPYADVTYDGYSAPSLLQVPGAAEVAVEFNSLSKTWNMAGWRVGMVVGNAEALRPLAKIKSNMDSGIFRPLQEAAVRALSLAPEWIADRNAVYQERIEILLEGLNAAGMEASPPRATLYIWARIPSRGRGSTDWSSEAFALALLKETGVSVAPGSFFGPAGEGYVRISVTAPTAKIREATERLLRF